MWLRRAPCTGPTATSRSTPTGRGPTPATGGTASGTVTVTITGTNDAATVSSDSKSVTEGDTAAALNSSGQLTIADPDAGEAHVVAQSTVHGTYGDFSIDANGAWTYTGNGRHGERYGDGHDHRYQRRGDGELGLEVCDGRRHGCGAQ